MRDLVLLARAYALALLEQARRHTLDPWRIDYRCAAIYCNLGFMTRGRNRIKEAIARHQRSIEEIEAALRYPPNDPDVPRMRINCYGARAVTLVQAGQDRAAVDDCLAVMDLAGLTDRETFLGIAIPALTRLHDYDRADRLLEEHPPDSKADGVTFYNRACRNSLLAPAVSQDSTVVSGKKDQVHGRFVARAIRHLEQARGVGFFQDFSNVAYMKQDSDLDGIRSEAGFKTLESGLYDSFFPTNPFD